MTWASLIGLIVSLVASMIRWAEARKVIEATEAKALAQILQESIHVLERVSKARDSALRDFDRVGGMPDDRDPNLRD